MSVKKSYLCALMFSCAALNMPNTETEVSNELFDDEVNEENTEVAVKTVREKSQARRATLWQATATGAVLCGMFAAVEAHMAIYLIAVPFFIPVAIAAHIGLWNVTRCITKRVFPNMPENYSAIIGSNAGLFVLAVLMSLAQITGTALLGYSATIVLPMIGAKTALECAAQVFVPETLSEMLNTEYFSEKDACGVAIAESLIVSGVSFMFVAAFVSFMNAKGSFSFPKISLPSLSMPKMNFASTKAAAVKYNAPTSKQLQLID